MSVGSPSFYCERFCDREVKEVFPSDSLFCPNPIGNRTNVYCSYYCDCVVLIGVAIFGD